MYRAQRIDQQVADEIDALLETGVLKNNQTNLFHRQSRAGQRLTSTARKIREKASQEASISHIQDQLSAEKVLQTSSIAKQREYEAEIKILISDGAGNAHMSAQRSEAVNNLRMKIDLEKNARRKSKATSLDLNIELRDVSTSSSGRVKTRKNSTSPRKLDLSCEFSFAITSLGPPLTIEK